MIYENTIPYLPYKLKAFFEKSGTIYDVTGLYLTDSKEDMIWVLNDSNTFKNHNIWRLKPLLRPLSDLNKPFIDGKTPLEILNITQIDLKNILNLPYNQIQQLLNWKIDIFNLIDKGIAYNVNLLELRECY